MKTSKLLEQHQRAIETLEAIDYFQMKLEMAKDNIRQINGMFPRLVEKHKHEAEICKMCIDRLWARYWKIAFPYPGTVPGKYWETAKK